MSFTNTANTVGLVQTFIGGSAVLNDTAFLTQIVPAVEDSIEKHLKRKLLSATYTDYYCGNNKKVLVLDEYPILADSDVMDVRIDNGGFFGSNPNGAFGSTTVLVYGTDYCVDRQGRDSVYGGPGILYQIPAIWPGRWEVKWGNLTPALKEGVGNIRVVYKAGYAPGTIPNDILMAEWELCARVRFMRNRGLLLQSEGLGEYNYGLMLPIIDKLLLGTVEALLAPFRRLRNKYKVLG